MFDNNPSLIQEIPRSLAHINPPPVPLVLIHDGGGTIYSYHCLGPLDRPVYGIHNPHYGTPSVWTGGIRQMAAHYASLIKSVVPRGDVILGGWSLGGLLSLQIARLLADRDSGFNVLGIVMIDSIYPCEPTGAAAGRRRVVVPHVVEWSATTKQETREAVQRCFDEAGRMVREWELPTWEAREDDDDNEEAAVYDPVMRGKDLQPPPVWLLRARESVPVLEKGSDGVSRVDTYRDDRYLGWDQYRRGMVVKVEDVPGHHYNIFSFENGHIDAVTEKLKSACVEVEQQAR
jgi:thioesterase domain-containing protein